MVFPLERSRRLRENVAVRRLVRETSVSVSDLIMPVFLVSGRGKKEPISSMPGIFRYSVDRVGDAIEKIMSYGIPGTILFGVPEKKDENGSGAWDEKGVVQEGIRKIKNMAPELLVVSDVCLCEYTDHGHCGVVKDEKILNDGSLELLAKISLSHAKAGADIIAPSDMMDGRVKTLREALDENGFQEKIILSYAAKYCSSFYGPFREAAESAPRFGDRKTYQLDPANSREALKETRQDIEEGADMIMVKPALPYLDIIAKVREIADVPLGAYNVSGEYSMIMAAAEKGWIDLEKTALETVTSIKRAGADFIITYFAEYLAERLG